MGKYRVAARDEISGDELRRFAVRWIVFACAALTVVIVALILTR